jgi:hypothetical protein
MMAKNSATQTFLSITYLICLGLGVFYAFNTFTPCKQDFEGGCSYGKLWAGIFSVVLAGGAVGSATIFYEIQREKFKEGIFKKAVLTAIGIPAAYIVIIVCLVGGTLLGIF